VDIIFTQEELCELVAGYINNSLLVNRGFAKVVQGDVYITDNYEAKATATKEKSGE